MEFKTWVEVSIERMETLKILELPDVFTTEPGAGRIRVVEQSEICSAALHQWNTEQPTIAVLPTSRPLVSFHPNVHVVPYSDHSSYQELEEFVSALKPISLVPIIGNCVPGGLSALLPSKRRHEILVPESVRHYMLRQPERQLSSSTYTSLRRRHLHPLAPKGVVFESPGRGTRTSFVEESESECLEQDVSEEEMDTESSGRDSDCILVDTSKRFTPDRNRRGAGDMWNLSIVQTVSEELDMAESVQLAQSNCAPVEILANTKTCLKPVRARKRPPETNATTINHRHSGYGYFQNNCTVSDRNSTIHHSGTDQNESSDNDSCTSFSTMTELQHEHVEEMENKLLKNLPFSEDDFKACVLQQKSFV